jgi:hypothetical protein
MRQIRIGDTVRAFLDPALYGLVLEIFYKKSTGRHMMVGGVPPIEAFAKVQLTNGKIRIAKTTELSILNL